MKVEKDFFRDELLILQKKCNKKPIIITGIYKHSDNDKWASFIHVKPYLNNRYHIKNYKIKRNQTLCAHVNINRNHIEKYIKLLEIFDNKTFIIVVNIINYDYYGMERIGLEIYEEYNLIPIKLKTKNTYISKSIYSKCYEYTKDDLLRI